MKEHGKPEIFVFLATGVHTHLAGRCINNMSENIFERISEIMQEDQHKAFVGHPSSKRFIQLNYSTDSKVIGRKYPQTDYINLGYAHHLKFYELPRENIKFGKIELYKSAKLTDLISTAAFSAYAYLLSKKALDIFKKFNLGRYRIYPATVYHKGAEHEYGVLHFTNDLIDHLDFTRSKFYVANILGGYEFDIEINSKEDYEKKRKQVKNAEYPNTEEWWYVNLKWGVWKEKMTVTDLFTIFSSDSNPYVSKELSEEILNKELTGFEFKRVYNIEN